MRIRDKDKIIEADVLDYDTLYDVLNVGVFDNNGNTQIVLTTYCNDKKRVDYIMQQVLKTGYCDLNKLLSEDVTSVDKYLKYDI